MISAFALSLALATPTETLAGSMEDYTECLRVYAGSGHFDRQAATDRARFALTQCRDRRSATVQLAIELLSPRFGAAEARERIEEALADVERIFPAMLQAGAGVQIPPAIAPMVRRYLTCFHDQMDERHAMAPDSVATYRAAVEASIAACAPVRSEAMAESEAVLSNTSEYRAAAQRQAAIRRAFDETDSQQRNFLEIMEVVRREQETNASN